MHSIVKILSKAQLLGCLQRCSSTLSKSRRKSEQQEPFCPIPDRSPTWVTNTDEAFGLLKDGYKVFIQGGSATPTLLINALHRYALKKNLKHIELYHLFTMGSYPFFDTDDRETFFSRSLFIGRNCREAVNAGFADFYPISLSEVPVLFRRGDITFDLALVSVTPPGKHGFASLGTSVDITRSAIQNSKHIIGQVNPNMPFTHGEGNVHISHMDYLIHGPQMLHQTEPLPPTVEELRVGKYIAENLVEDGSTIEAGIGAIPQFTMSLLTGHRGLGIHTEMFSDSLVDLVSLGVITNAHKTTMPGKIVSSFVVGTEKVYHFMDNNPLVEMGDVEWVANPEIIAQNPKPTCINTCMAIDLSGQISSDSLGDYLYSGVGGVVDFMRGSAISLDGQGKPIIALTSRTRSGKPKIVPTLSPGTGVVLTRAHVHYVVTEYGLAYLFGRNLRQRAYLLIQIAHPDDRETLEKAAFETLKVMPSLD